MHEFSWRNVLNLIYSLKFTFESFPSCGFFEATFKNTEKTIQIAATTFLSYSF